MKKLNQLSERKKEILDAFFKNLKSKKRVPTIPDMLELGITREAVRSNFGSMKNLRKIAAEINPKLFNGVIHDGLFTPQVFSELSDNIKKYKRFVITTAVGGCKVHAPFLKSIKGYCKKYNAKLLVLPTSDPAHNLDNNPQLLPDSVLAKEAIVFKDLRLNKNLWISEIKIGAKQINPLIGLKRIGQRNGSFIFASPKQALEPIATSNVKIPSVLMTTGACTIPNYSTGRYLSQRTAYLANHDHVLGAIIVEIENDTIFHFRQVQSDSRGAFIDLSYQHLNGKTTRVKPEAITIGDLHSGEIDYKALNSWKELSEVTGATRWILHDVFNGYSINHHEREKRCLQATKAVIEGKLLLKAEIVQLAKDLKNILSFGLEELVIVKSNHDEFLESWLNRGDYVNDPYNHLYALELAQQYILQNDPLKYAIETSGILTNKELDKIKWLNRDEDYVIAKIENGAHGDKGANGSRANPGSLEMAYGNCNAGHSHSPLIRRGIWIAGTTSLLKLRYNQGPSSWAHVSILTYSNGSRQMVFSINGKWRK